MCADGALRRGNETDRLMKGTCSSLTRRFLAFIVLGVHFILDLVYRHFGWAAWAASAEGLHLI